MRELRTDWTLDEVRDIYNQPLLELAYPGFCSTPKISVDRRGSGLYPAVD